MSVYRAEAIVASGVRPWQLISDLSSATLPRIEFGKNNPPTGGGVGYGEGQGGGGERL